MVFDKNIIISVIIIILIIGVIGAFVGLKKNEPVYKSKIEKIMFDDKAPKFVITVPMSGE